MAAMQSAVIFRPPIPLLNCKTTAAAAGVFSSSLPRKQQNAKKQQQQQDLPLKSNLQQEITAATVNSDHSKAESSALRGSDVLLALQKAATQKKKKRKTARRNERGGGGGGVAEAELQDFDYSNVRPINVRAEWMERINELEIRVQELKSQYHY